MMQPLSRPLGEKIAVALLVTATIAAPLAIGSSSIGARCAIEATLASVALLWIASGSRSKVAMAMPLLITAVVCLQLIPLPENILVTVAPVSAGAWKLVAGGIKAHWATASVDPAASLVAIRRLLLGLATLLASADMMRYQSLRRYLTAAMAISGILILALGLVFGKAKGEDYLLLGVIPLAGPIYKHVNPILMPMQTSGAGLPQEVTAAGKHYIMDAGSIGDGFGPYIYSNHFAGALVLTIPIVIGVWLFVTYGRFATVARYSLAAAVGGCSVFTVGALANSRGGMAALLVALLALAALVSRKPWARYLTLSTFICSLAGIMCLASLLAYGGDHSSLLAFLPDSIRPVIAELLNDTRTIPAQVGLRMLRASPLLGTGLNTYQFMFPRFYRGNFTLFYAHSDFAQFLAETGIVGIILLGAACFVVIHKLTIFWKSAPEPYRLLAAGPWAALAGFCVHSCFDWNLHLPANSLLAIMASALVLSSVPVNHGWAKRIPFSQRLWAVALAGACLISLMLLMRDARSDYAQQGLRRAIVGDRIAKSAADKKISMAALSSAIGTGETIAAWDSANATLAAILSNAYLHAADCAELPSDREAMLGHSDRWAMRASSLSAAARGLPQRDR
jgi:hypothetical protein